MNLYSLKPHLLSKILPSIYGQDFDAVRDSIKKNGGPRYPIWIFQGAILDGNQRVNICRELRIHQDRIRYEEFNGTWDDACQLVWDLNFARRQLNAGQRAAAVQEYYSFLALGDPEVQRNEVDEKSGGTNVPPISNAEAAEKAGTSVRPIKEIKFVAAHAKNPKKVIGEIKRGKRSLHKTAEQLKKVEADGQAEDRLGMLIPVAALPFWERRDEIQSLMDHASDMRVAIGKIKDGDPLYAKLSKRGEMVRELDAMFNQLTGILPSYVCGECNGQMVINGKTCGACKGTGLLSVYEDRNILPREKRANARTGS